MSTYIEIQNRVASDFLNRSSYSAEVKRAILAAIRFYERRRWRFNETATSIATVASQSWLTLPTNFLYEDILKLTSNGSTNRLNRRDLSYVTEMRDNASSGIPTEYTIYANKIELALVPSAIYTCPLYYVKSLPELSADVDTNAWTQGGMQDVIVYHATHVMWSSVVRNNGEASKAAALEKAALSIIEGERDLLQFDSITPTEF